MSNNYDLLLNKENNNNLEPFDKIEQGQKRYIPNIPSVISDMKKNNMNINSGIGDINIKDNTEITSNKNEENNIKETNENMNINLEIENQQKNENGFGNTIINYWNTFRNNQTVSTIINPFQDDGEFVNKVYKIYSCITISLILLVILLSVTLS